MAFPRPYGRYVLEERLAMGGMAEIFRARTATAGFEKRVCIKRVLPQFLEDEEFVTMFRDEARTAAKLQHANVVQVFDFGEVEEETGNTLFLAMELVEGSDLRRIAEASRKKKIPFEIGEVVQIGIEVCRGLHHAHTLQENGKSLGIVHRDVSPHNILISRNGEVKVTDFGIAKAAERATHTSTGIVKGKVAYMSPEQAEGKPFDHRLDQWATGVVLWELLCGERLFRGDNDMTILRKIMNHDVPAPSSVRADVPKALEEIVLRALAEDPGHRFPDMRHMELALQRFLFSGVIDPTTAEVRNVLPRIFDAQVDGPPPSPRRTNVLPAVELTAAPSQPASESPPSTVMDIRDLLPSTTSEEQETNVFTSSGKSQPAPAPSPSATTMMAEDPQALAAAVASFEQQRSRASQKHLRSSSSPPTTAPTGAGASKSALSSPSDSHRNAPAPVTVIEEGALAAEALRVAQPPNDDEGTPATRTLVPAGGERSAAAPRSSPTPEPLTTTSATAAKSRAPLLAAAAILGVGAVVGVSLAGSPNSTPSAPAVAQAPASPPAPPSPPPADPAPPPAAAREPAPKEKPAEPLPAPPPASPERGAAKGAGKPEKAEKAPGTVFVDVVGGWARVSLGKKELGETPLTLKLAPGTYNLTLSSGDGTKKKVVPLTVTPGAKMQVKETL